MTRPCSATPTASGNWPRCSPPPTMNAATTYVRPSTSSDARRARDRSGQRSLNSPRARAGVWLGTHIQPSSSVTPLGRAAADLASTASQLDPDGQAAARAASLDLIWAALLIDASPFGYDPPRTTA